MGKIIIELPQNVNRYYLLESVESANLLLEGLEKSATRVKGNPAAAAEDLEDVRAAKRARKQKGFVTLDELKAELEL